MNNNLDDILKLINKTVIDNYSIKLWVPSLIAHENVESILFKPLSISQQKDLISTALAQDLYNTEFIKKMYTILKENYLSNDIVSFNHFNILDKLIILLSIRSNINSRYLDNDINSIINKIQTSDFSVFQPQVLESENIKLYCSLPSIYTEFLCESEREVFETEDANEQIQHVVSETVINELAKFCFTAEINDKTIIFDKFTFTERKKILNQLPAFLLEKALNYIISCRKQLEEYLTINNSEDTKDILQINGVFFSTV